MPRLGSMVGEDRSIFTVKAFAASDRAYKKSIELLSEIDDRPDRSQYAAEYAKKLRARGDVDAAFHYLEMARGR